MACCLQRGFVQLRVVDGDRRLRGDAGQHVQIVLLKPLPLVARVDLDHAQRIALAVDQRSAHHRANAQIGDALAGVEPRVVGRVGREDRLLRLHHLVDDRAADAHLVFHVRAAVLDGLGHQQPVGRCAG